MHCGDQRHLGLCLGYVPAGSPTKAQPCVPLISTMHGQPFLIPLTTHALGYYIDKISISIQVFVRISQDSSTLIDFTIPKMQKVSHNSSLPLVQAILLRNQSASVLAAGYHWINVWQWGAVITVTIYKISFWFHKLDTYKRHDCLPPSKLLVYIWLIVWTSLFCHFGQVQTCKSNSTCIHVYTKTERIDKNMYNKISPKLHIKIKKHDKEVGNWRYNHHYSIGVLV